MKQFRPVSKLSDVDSKCSAVQEISREGLSGRPHRLISNSHLFRTLLSGVLSELAFFSNVDRCGGDEPCPSLKLRLFAMLFSF